MNQRDDGFAMTDALTAILISALFMSGLVEGLRLNAQLRSSSIDKLTATVIASELLNSPPDTEEGSLERDGKVFSWAYSANDNPFDAGDRSWLQEAVVSVSWPKSGQSMGSVTLSVNRLRGGDDE